MAAGLYGSADIPSGAATLVTPGTGMIEAAICTLNVCNRNSTGVAISIAIGTGANPAAADWIEYAAALGGNLPLERGQLSLSQGEKVWVLSDTASVSARLHGVPST